MPSGLRCRDAQGRVILDVVNRLPRILGSFVAYPGQTYSIALPPSGGGTYFQSIRPMEVETWDLDGAVNHRHRARISGNTLIVDNGTIMTQIIYGVF
ncbi:p23 [Xanthomonas phage Xop411]|uniref:p23 n=1 Tax=Xanthomonas phage Xop411 TaxID=2913975 RepID=A5H1M6_9CAUD|nr:p23 [Xanthomonas phage Xop411]ABK00170.1 p23 [Xanthomonas phage Xop411]